MSEWLCMCLSGICLCKTGRQLFADTCNPIPSVDFWGDCSRILKYKIFFERFCSVVLDSLLSAFPLSSVFLTFFYSVGLPLRTPSLLWISPLNYYFFFYWTKWIGYNYYLVEGSSLLLLSVSLHFPLPPSILFLPCIVCSYAPTKGFLFPSPQFIFKPSHCPSARGEQPNGVPSWAR